MAIRVAINGFGRIGRNTFKSAFGRVKGIEFVAINDLSDTKSLAQLLKHDSTYREYDKSVRATKSQLIVGGKKIQVFAERDPKNLPWKELDIDVVLECTGFFRTEETAGQHLTAGAKRVIISAPAKGGNVPTHVLGVNPKVKKSSKIINNASCTTNCIAPVAAVINNSFGVKRAMMTTIHGYTADQNLQDGPHSDPRRARAAAVNMIPTSTGAAIATAEALPAFEGIFDGMSIRVPVPVVSIADFTFMLKKKTTVEEVNAALTKASKHPFYKGVLDVTNEPLVSSDFIGNPFSSIADLSLTKVIQGDFLKIIAWYDNEWGYSSRLGEMAREVGMQLKKKK